MANEFKIKKGLIVTGADGGTVVDIQGSQGQLFSVTDDLSGSIFAVSDISGVPILDVNSSGTSYFDGNVGIGTTSPGATLELNSDTGNAAKLKIGRQNTATNYLELGTIGGSSVINAIGIAGVNASLIFNRSTTTATTQSMIIDGSGNVGIGTTSPSAPLSLGNGGAESLELNHNISSSSRILSYNRSNNTYRQLQLDAFEHVFKTSSSERMRITSAGNVGIGNTNPSYLLDVGAANIENPVDYIRLNPTNGNSGGTSNTLGGGLIWAPNYSTYTKKSAGIIAVGEGNYFRTGLAFFTNNSASATGNYSERMRIDMDGNVGIGTTTFPTTAIGERELLVQGAIVSKPPGVDDYYSYLKSNWAADGAFELGIQGADTNHKLITTSNYYHGTQLNFHTSDQKRMVIDTNGNVGIGETSPQAKLDIYDTFTKTAANPNTVEVFHTGSVSTNNIYPVAGLFTQRVSGSANVFATGLVGVAEKLGDYGYIARGVQGIGKLSGNITVNNADMQYMGVEGRIEMEGSNSVNLDDRAYSFYGTAEIDSGSHLKEYHGLYLNTPTNNGTILNKYGVSQVDANSKNYFAGNVGIGTTSPDYKLDVRAGNGNISQVFIKGGNSTVTAVGEINSELLFGSNDNSVSHGNIGGKISSVTETTNGAYTGMAFYTYRQTSPLLTEKMRITNDGNVGIGTTSPGTKLTVDAGSNIASFRSVGSGQNNKELLIQTGGDRVILDAKNADDGTATALAFESGSLEKARITSGGNVGIGTTSPSTKLHIVQPGGSSQLTLERTGAAAGKAVLAGAAEGLIVYDDAYGAKMYVGTSGTYNGKVGIGTTSPGAKLTVKGSDSVNAFKITDSGDGDGLKITSHATQGTYAQVYNASHTQTIMLDARTDNSNRHTYFNGGGNVGIGTTSPANDLHISSATGSARLTSTAGGANVFMESADNNSTRIRWSSNSNFALRNDTTATDVVTINQSGNVGIGTTSPRDTLEIVGNMRFVDGEDHLMIKPNNAIHGADFIVGDGVDATDTPVMSLNGLYGGQVTIQTQGNTIANKTVLDVQGTQGQLFSVTDDLSGDIFSVADISGVPIMNVNSNGTSYFDGNVGIGTTSPSTKLDIINSGLSTMFRLSNTEANATTKYGAILGRHYTNTEENVTGMLITSSSNALSGQTVSIGGGISAANAVNNVIFYTAANNTTLTGSERMRITSGGNVGIGTTSPGSKLDVDGKGSFGDATTYALKLKSSGGARGINILSNDGTSRGGIDWSTADFIIRNSSDDELLKLNYSSKNATLVGNVTATNFILSSDKRLKENIEKVCDNGVKVDWKTFELKTEKGQKRYGVIAQELEENHPEFVKTDDEGFKSVKYIDLLIAKIAELEARLEKAGI